jgi:uncharacterized membrane protein YfcA
VIATSSGAASGYVRRGLSNIRIGLFLEIATSSGALMGAALAAYVPAARLALLFGVVLLYSAFASQPQDPQEECAESHSDPLARKLKLESEYPTPAGPQRYTVHRVPLGFSIMVGAGALSGMLGIGSGAVKVLAMDNVMRIPFKVSTATSNFMIGVTAAASAGVYLRRGYIDPGLSMPVMLGVLLGSLAGSHILMAVRSNILRTVFRSIVVVLGLEMIYNGWTGRL